MVDANEASGSRTAASARGPEAADSGAGRKTYSGPVLSAMIEKMRLADGDLLVVRSPDDDPLDDDSFRALAELIDVLKTQIVILQVPSGIEVERFSEEDMGQAGWFRHGIQCPLCRGNASSYVCMECVRSGAAGPPSVDKVIREGTHHKGGRNEPPTTPRPGPPAAQNAPPKSWPEGMPPPGDGGLTGAFGYLVIDHPSKEDVQRHLKTAWPSMGTCPVEQIEDMRDHLNETVNRAGFLGFEMSASRLAVEILDQEISKRKAG